MPENNLDQGGGFMTRGDGDRSTGAATTSSKRKRPNYASTRTRLSPAGNTAFLARSVSLPLIPMRIPSSVDPASCCRPTTHEWHRCRPATYSAPLRPGIRPPVARPFLCSRSRARSLPPGAGQGHRQQSRPSTSIPYSPTSSVGISRGTAASRGCRDSGGGAGKLAEGVARDPDGAPGYRCA